MALHISLHGLLWSTACLFFQTGSLSSQVFIKTRSTLIPLALRYAAFIKAVCQTSTAKLFSAVKCRLSERMSSAVLKTTRAHAATNTDLLCYPAFKMLFVFEACRGRTATPDCGQFTSLVAGESTGWKTHCPINNRGDALSSSLTEKLTSQARNIEWTTTFLSAFLTILGTTCGTKM